MNKETWIDEVLQTARKITPVEGNPYLYTRIESTLQKQKLANRLQPNWMYALASIIVLAFILNMYAWRDVKPTKNVSGIQQVMQEYGWGNKDAYSLDY
jgi:hypothetical protein